MTQRRIERVRQKAVRILRYLHIDANLSLECQMSGKSFANSSRHAREPNMACLTGSETLLRTGPVAIDLPSSDTTRWVARRKAAVVSAVRSGAIGLEEACGRYELSEEEFLAWERAIATHGVAGLRITRFQIYRNTPLRMPAKSRY